MKRILAIILVFIMAFSLIACGAKEESSDSAEETVGNDGQLDVSDIGAVEVEENLFTVEVTVPADFLGEEVTQEALDEQSGEEGWKSATLNSDGSVTYVMTKAQHAELMGAVKISLEETFASMIGSEDYPNLVSINANDNYTEFEIVTKNESTDLNEMFSTYLYYMSGAMYNIYNGTPVDNVNVKFINEASGDVIEEYNSRDMETTEGTEN